jgi:hypothetical protein
MNTSAAEQAAASAGDRPGATDRTERRCVLFGSLEVVAWIVRESKAASCPVARSTLRWRSIPPQSGALGQCRAGGGSTC